MHWNEVEPRYSCQILSPDREIREIIKQVEPCQINSSKIVYVNKYTDGSHVVVQITIQTALKQLSNIIWLQKTICM